MKEDTLRSLKYLDNLINKKRNYIQSKKEKMEEYILQVYEGDNHLSLLGTGFIYKVDLEDTIETIDDSKDELKRIFTIDKTKKIWNFTVGYPIPTKTFLTLDSKEINELDKYLFYVGQDNIELLFKITKENDPQYINIQGSRFFYNDFIFIDKNLILLRRSMKINNESDKQISKDFSGHYMIINGSVTKEGDLAEEEDLGSYDPNPKTKML